MSCDCNPIVVGEAGPPGPQGLASVSAVNGVNGINAFTVTTASYVQPAAIGSIVLVSVAENRWMAINQYVYVQQAGIYKVSTIPSGTTSVYLELIKSDVSYGATIPTNKKITPSGSGTFVDTIPSLSVLGDSSLDGNVTINDSMAQKSLVVKGDTNSSLFVVNGSTDRVGVSTLTPETKFQVVGDTKIGNSASPADLTVTKAASFNTAQSSSGDFVVKSANEAGMFFVDASANRIGVKTSSPGADFDINGELYVSTMVVNPALTPSVSFVVNNTGGGYNFIANTALDKVGVNVNSLSGGDATLTVAGSGSFSDYLRAGTSTFYVDTTSNRVGVNTVSPALSLDVVGNANISNNFSVASSLIYADTVISKVGVKTLSPAFDLDVNGSLKATDIRLSASSGNAVISKFLFGSSTSQTIDMAPGDYKTVTVTMTGLAIDGSWFVIPSVVLPTSPSIPSTLLQDVVVTASVSTTDTVSITAQNISTTDYSVASVTVTFKVLAFKAVTQ